MSGTDPRAAAVLDFWRAAGPARWFTKDAAFDAAFRERFLELHFAAARRELDDWSATADGVLALLLLPPSRPRRGLRAACAGPPRHRPRFGRFPHRNTLLGRSTTAAEAAFLAAGGFAG